MSVQQNIDVIAIMDRKGNITPIKMKIDDQVFTIVKCKRLVKGITATCGTFAWLYDVFCNDSKWHRLFYLPKETIWFVEGNHTSKEAFSDYTQDQIISDHDYLVDICYED